MGDIQGGPSTPGATKSAACGAIANVGPTPLRRLTRVEYRNTVADLFGVPSPSNADLPDDAADSLGFTTTTSQSLSPEGALKYFDVAASVGSALIAKLPDVFPCATGTAEADCVKVFLNTTGTKMFRRPMTADEHTYFTGVFTKGRADDASVAEAALALIQTLLVTPQFLFLIEPAEGSAEQPSMLDSWQVAARLSYLLWQTTPDATLLTAASRDELKSRDAVLAQARRMLADPRAKTAVASFFDQWLMLQQIDKVQKDTKTYPDVTQPVLAALAQESRMFVDDLFWNQEGNFGKLLMSPSRVRNKTLSTFYGDSLSQTDAPATVSGEVNEKSFGLFSQAGFLMGISRNDDDASIFRGKFVLTRMFCQPIFLPPPGVATPLPSIKPGVTSRQRVEMHTGTGVCVGCHGKMNPFGFALEHFDATGRWRDKEGDLPIDTAAQASSSDLGPFDGARDLSSKLASSEMVKQCVVSQMFQYALRRETTDDDQCGVAALQQTFVSSDLSMKELLLSITQSSAFFARVEPKE